MVYPTTILRDGTTLSIQASSAHYCAPKGDRGPFKAVEVACITRPDGKRRRGPRSWGQGEDGLYGWVPVESVARFIRRHGGVISGPGLDGLAGQTVETEE